MRLIATEPAPDRSLRFSRFHSDHELTHSPPTPVEKPAQAREASHAKGLRCLYAGNVPDSKGAKTTFSPNCKKVTAARYSFAVTRLDSVTGKGRLCGTKISGVWS